MNALLSRSRTQVRSVRRLTFTLVCMLMAGTAGLAQTAPPVPAPTPSLKKATVADIKALRANKGDKYRLVNFWATWCAPCITEFPDLMQLHRAYEGKPFEVVTVAAQQPDEEADVMAFLKKQKAGNPNFMLDDGDKDALLAAFDKKWQGALPFTLLLDPRGKVLYRKQGPVDLEEVKRVLDKSLAAQKR